MNKQNCSPPYITIGQLSDMTVDRLLKDKHFLERIIKVVSKLRGGSVSFCTETCFNRVFVFELFAFWPINIPPGCYLKMKIYATRAENI